MFLTPPRISKGNPKSPLLDSELVSLQRILTPRMLSTGGGGFGTTDIDRGLVTAGTGSSQFINYNKAVVFASDEPTEGGPESSEDLKRRFNTFLEEMNLPPGKRQHEEERKLSEQRRKLQIERVRSQEQSLKSNSAMQSRRRIHHPLFPVSP